MLVPDWKNSETGRQRRKACRVTEEMRENARSAEWREAAIAYREATEREKFRHALDLQKRS